MKIGFVWTGFTGYMADCWRELASRPGVELKVWIEECRKSDTAFDVRQIMQGLDYSWTYSDQIGDRELEAFESEIGEFAPDVLFVCGWARRLPPFVAKSGRLCTVPKIMCCDMPWEWKIRKFAARILLWRHLRRFKKIMVPGLSAARYARWLGFNGEDIIRGEYGVDIKRFVSNSGLGKSRKGFVFVGRLVKAKGIRILAAAYRLYRQMMGGQENVWDLHVYGTGPEECLLKDVDGVKLHGFVQPDALPEIYSSAGAFVLASEWEPWGVVLVEAAASGMPIICTDKCGARHEVLKENGVVVKAGNHQTMANAMCEIAHGNVGINGESGRGLARAYSCESWADRVIEESMKCIA